VEAPMEEDGMSYLESAIQRTLEGARPDKRLAEFVYIFAPDVFSTEKKFKVGWSGDWIAREKALRTACPTGRMVFVLPCADGRTLEALIFKELASGPNVEVIGEVVFGLDVPVLRHLLLSLRAAQQEKECRPLPTAPDAPPATPPPAPQSLRRTHARDVLIMKKEEDPNAFYYRYLDDETKKRRGAWDEAELRLLHDVVARMGPNFWGLISCGIPGRVGYQCRSAYHSAAYRNLFQAKNP
jgi:hypothetical protein